MRPLLLCLLLACASLAHAFEDPALAAAADQYRALLAAQAGKPPAPDALAKVDAALRDKRWGAAIVPLEALVRAHPDDGTLWLRLARARGNQNPQDELARPAAYAALRLAGGANDKAAALFVLGRLTEVNQDARGALALYDEGLALTADAGIARRAEALREQLALRPTGAEADVESDPPRLCVSFSEPLAKGRQVHFEDFLQIEPALPGAASAHAEHLCVDGAAWGQSYRVTVRAGVPAADGRRRSQASESFTVTVPDRPARLAFRGATYVLPRRPGQSIPLVSVNVPAAELRLLRINDRNLIQRLQGGELTEPLYGYQENEIAAEQGEEVWRGTVDLRGERNRETTTLLPVESLLRAPQPGIYVLTAAPPRGAEEDDYEARATQWLVVSDLGLSVFRGEDGLHVFVRSLDSARPVPGVELQLYARNNAELARASTDAEGHARFDPGLLRASGGRAALGLYAYGPGGDFNVLDLGQPAFDLSDRGVDGRTPPGALDAYVYAERGVYRPGEAVELVTLLRDAAADAVTGLPLTLIVRRPDGEEAERRTLQPGAPGAYHTRLELPANARTGTWSVRVHADPGAPAIGELRFQVEDFVAQRIRLDLAADAAYLTPQGSATLAIAGQFLYGAPAGGLPVEVDAVLEEDPDPYPQYPDYRFGLAQDSFEPTRPELPGLPEATDAEGRAAARLALPEPPDTGRPLRLSVRAAISEPGGRPVRRLLRLPYRTQPYAIGIRAGFDADAGVAAGASAPFELIAVAPDGAPRAAAGLRYALYRESYDYYWYYTDSRRLDYKLIVRDGAPVRAGNLELAAGTPGRLGFDGLDAGPYRLEVFDADGVASSVRFHVGWYAGPAAGERPDQLRVSLDKPRYAAGDKARVRVQAPFAGEVLVAVASHKLWATHSLRVGPEGGEFELPVSADWGSGVYVTATAFRPGREAAALGPGRAIGLAWLALDPAPRTLGVNLDAPAEWRPRQSVRLPVSVAGAQAGEPVTLTLAAVDEGILQLTDFAAPDPNAHYLGKRRLGLDLLDLYGRLIPPAAGEPGELRSGGDAEGRNLEGAQLKQRASVALFSGFVTPDAQGRAEIPLTLPDFNGSLRLMAVAWDRQRVGHAEARVPVRDPVVAEVYLPRFLAPGDRARVQLQLDDLAAAPGAWRAALTVEGPLAFDDPAAFDVNFGPDQGRQVRRTLALRATGGGDGRVVLTLSGPDGSRSRHEWPLTVRPAQPVEAVADTRRLDPGASVVLGAGLLDGFEPGSGRVAVTLAARPPLDVAALLDALDRYPYGCAEQTTSRALPLLYANALARDWLGAEREDTALRGRVQEAIGRLLAQQRSDGGFGLWSAFDDADPWLTAYVGDLLVRARELDYLVPEAALKRTLDALHATLADGADPDARALAARAHAAYVLARAQAARAGELRYLADAWLARLPSRQAAAQLGAALARYGERERAQAAFERAFAIDAREPGLGDYGSGLRDRAALLALALEAGVDGPRSAELANELAAESARKRYLSTQEQAWLLLAAQALGAGTGTLAVTRDGQPLAAPGGRARVVADAAALAGGVTLANAGSAAAWLRTTRSGVPAAERPAAAEGIAVTRQFYGLDGQPLAAGAVKAGSTLVAVISGEAAGDAAVQALVVDLLPAGFELENARLGPNRSATELAWLPTLAEPRHVELRDDRYVAALELGEQRRFTLAYLVRAVTPGEFRVPAVFAEDMYRPEVRGRGAPGSVKIE
ncbi:hypothetical protein EV699_10248 [Plasticicumulans lactativorans]|uniref:Uncharacterized protein n=1 Tax=Plasticicumulans lactativorans TaxID=1133106 RepID=A0A4R2LAN6_9GAMM|nr:alpha-2-macroglobulin [Plasticicumulans lactativorans]TCO83350.1 hypothetical protein EV699_10248 [Plasticicumulans lactativorans]